MGDSARSSPERCSFLRSRRSSRFTTAASGGYDCIPHLRELAMKRHVGGLISFSLLTLIIGGCQPDAPIGLPVLAGRVEPKPPNVLRDGIAFFTREFSASGGVAIMQPDGSGRQPLAGAEAGFEPAISPKRATDCILEKHRHRCHSHLHHGCG